MKLDSVLLDTLLFEIWLHDNKDLFLITKLFR